jgi:hypothetical protein
MKRWDFLDRGVMFKYSKSNKCCKNCSRSRRIDDDINHCCKFDCVCDSTIHCKYFKWL